jgi:hypothetical protein
MATKLTVKDDNLYVGTNLLIYRYREGDVDTCRWPFKNLDDRRHLAGALFDAFECGELFDRVVELPDGILFDIDMEL